MDLEDIENSSNVQAETSFEVQLYIYDLSRGLAKSLTPLFLGELSDFSTPLPSISIINSPNSRS